MEQDKTEKISISEAEKYPRKSFTVGGTTLSGYYNADAGEFYIIRDDRNIDVIIVDEKARDKITRYSAPERESPHTSVLQELFRSRPEEDTSDGSSVSDPEKSTDETAEKDAEALRMKKLFSGSKGRKRLIMIILAVMVISAFAIGFTLISGDSRPDASSEPAHAEHSDDPDSGKGISVIKVTADLIPGDKITEDNIRKANISSSEFDMLSVQDAQPYRWSRKETLIDQYATSYIAEGSCLTFDNVDSVYLQDTNPWSDAAENETFITVPVDEEIMKKLCYGSILDLTVTVQKTNTDPGSQDLLKNDTSDDSGTDDTPGMEHDKSVTQSLIVDTYALKHVTVCDVLNASEESLYEAYTSLMDIPIGEQRSYIKMRMHSDDSFYEKVTPGYISVLVTDKQAAVLGDLTSGDTSVQCDPEDSVDQSSEKKKIYSKRSKALIENIDAAYREVLKEKKDADQQKDNHSES